MQLEFEDREIAINGVKWRAIKGQRYPNNYDYYALVDKIESNEWDELSAYRTLFRVDLWALMFFVMKVEVANHPFVINASQELMDHDGDKCVHLWAREHFKSTLISTARNIQKILNSHGDGAKFPEKRIGLFSYAKTPAVKLLRPIKLIFEQSEILKACYPDIFYKNPEAESPKWGEDALILKRRGFYKEATIEAHGLIEGMPTGSHFTDRTYDDIETEDLVGTPEIMEKVKRAIDVSQFLGTAEGSHEFVGTPYHWNGPLQYVMAKKYEDGRSVYTVSKKPGTVDGTPMGAPVLMSQEKIDFWRTDKRSFNAQCLLDPTPSTERPLNYELVKFVSRKSLPTNLYKFMLVDPAGDKKKRTDGRVADSWALGVIGVEPVLKDIGASRIFLLDARIRPMSEAEAMTEVVEMYCRNGRILKLGVEKVAQSTAETHITNALRAKGRRISVETGSLHIVRPSGRNKQQRIESALQWPMENGCLHIVDDVDEEALARLRDEMDKFPYWHDDGLDMLSYVYDLVKIYPFNTYRPGEPESSSKEDAWDRAFKKKRGDSVSKNSWLEV